MAGLVPAIHAFARGAAIKDADAYETSAFTRVSSVRYRTQLNTEQLCGSAVMASGNGCEMSDFILFSLGISSIVITATMIIFLWHL